MKFLVVILLTGTFLSCTSTAKEHEETPSSAKQDAPNTEGKITYKAIHLGEIGWGYQIFKGSRLLIDQQNVPAVNGLYGFPTEQQAERAAEFVIEKMHEGWDKPSVSAEELDSIGVINLDSLVQLSIPE